MASRRSKKEGDATPKKIKTPSTKAPTSKSIPKKMPGNIAVRARALRDRLPKGLNRKPLKERPIASILPNMTTILGLCAGLTSVRMAMLGHYDFALLAILIAALMDALDGKIARYLNTTSRFGAELDSFSDLICFGLSPALVMYFRTVKNLDSLGWMLVLFCTVCMALRLARFNVRDIEGNAPKWSAGFFTGIPAPAAGYLIMSPLYLHLQFQIDAFLNPYFCGAVMLLSGGLMVSTIPTFALKNLSIQQKHVLPLMLLFAIAAGVLLTEPYLMLSIIAVAYVATFPFSYRSYKRLEKEQMPPIVQE